MGFLGAYIGSAKRQRITESGDSPNSILQQLTSQLGFSEVNEYTEEVEKYIIRNVYNEIIKKLQNEHDRIAYRYGKYHDKKGVEVLDKRKEALKSCIQALEDLIIDSLGCLSTGSKSENNLKYDCLLDKLKQVKLQMHSTRRHTGWGLIGTLFSGPVTGQKNIEKLIKELEDKIENTKKFQKAA